MPDVFDTSPSSQANGGFSTVYVSLLVGLYGLVGIVAALALHPIGPSLWMALPVATVIGAPQALAGVRWTPDHPVPAKPKPPAERKPRLRGVGPEPSTRILEPSDRCEICGRTLTNPESQLARVGSECIKTYGPRYKRVPNPAYKAWEKRRAKAEVELAARRVEAKAKHQKALERYEERLAAWNTKYFGPEVQQTLRRQTRRRRHRVAAVCGAAATGSAYAVTALFA